jgi:hypothetical protein
MARSQDTNTGAWCGREGACGREERTPLHRREPSRCGGAELGNCRPPVLVRTGGHHEFEPEAAGSKGVLGGSPLGERRAAHGVAARGNTFPPNQLPFDRFRFARLPHSAAIRFSTSANKPGIDTSSASANRQMLRKVGEFLPCSIKAMALGLRPAIHASLFIDKPFFCRSPAKMATTCRTKFSDLSGSIRRQT